jgi:predicted NBD/HSP70 family sugar kinase
MAISHAGNSLDEVKLFPTNHNFAEAMSQMKAIADDFSRGEKYHAVVGGVRAYDKKKGQLFNQPNFPMWVDDPLLSKFKELFGPSVYIENDAALVGLGEAVYGAGKGSKIVAYITLSTGVGGARITNGKIDETSYSFEPGNMLISAKNGEVEYLEKLVSGTAVKEKYGKLPTDLEDEMAWEEITELLAIGLNNVSVMWSPEIIVLGGSVPQRINFEKVNAYLKRFCKIYPETPLVKKDELGEKGGLYGALAYLKNLP